MEIRPRTFPSDDGAPMCAHGFAYGHGCDDCSMRTWLATRYYRERTAAGLLPWEAIPTRQEEWLRLTIAGQRDELLAAVGLLLEFAVENVDAERQPLMAEAITTMGRRYGPWAR